jgi:hypothetical protein
MKDVWERQLREHALCVKGWSVNDFGKWNENGSSGREVGWVDAIGKL